MKSIQSFRGYLNYMWNVVNLKGAIIIGLCVTILFTTYWYTHGQGFHWDAIVVYLIFLFIAYLIGFIYYWWMLE